MPERIAHRKALLALISAVVAGAVAALWAFSEPTAETGRGGLYLLVLGGAILASSRTVRVSCLRVDVVPFHPFVLMTLALFGIRSAALIGALSIVTAASLRNELPPAIRVLFNLGATTLATVAAGQVFLRLGGPGAAPSSVTIALSAAAGVFFLVKAALIATAISLELGQGFARSWSRSLRWTLVPDLAGVPIVLLALRLVDLSPLGAVGVAFAPCVLLWLYYRVEGARRVEDGSAATGTSATV